MNLNVSLILKGCDVIHSIYDKINAYYIHSSKISKEIQLVPRLDIIQVGERPDSSLYIKLKKRRAEQMGFICKIHNFSETVSQGELLLYIKKLNNNLKVNGILVQMPLPEHIDHTIVNESILPEKDVDGFHSINMGKMIVDKSYSTNKIFNSYFLPCTAVAILEIIDHYQLPVSGKDIVIVGASQIIELPISVLLFERGATVQICHILTQNLKDKCKKADIIISATGCGHLIKSDYIGNNTICIDVGICEQEINGKKKITGDFDYTNIVNTKKCTAITPVPGGVGPITISVLMRHLLQAFIQQNQKNKTKFLSENNVLTGS